MPSTKRTNSNPIPDTLETIPGYPDTLKIYQSTDSSFYKMRCWMNGKMIPRSTKTKNKDLARKAARDFYDELIRKRALGQPLTEGGQFSRAFYELLDVDKQKVAAGERSQSLVDDAEYIFKKDLLPFFKNDQLKSITHKRILEYIAKVRERDISNKTLKGHLLILSKTLKHAFNTDRLDRLPLFPTISIENNPRGWFTDEQYTLLLKTCTECKGQMPKKTYTPITDELRLLTVFMVNTFLRPGDMKNMRNRDIGIVRDNGSPYLRINATSKVTKSAVISMPLAVDAYKRILAIHKELGFANSDDFVLLPALTNRGYALQTWRLQFNFVLHKADLKTAVIGVNEDGTDETTDRTLYSLRHSAIMFRLLNGDIDLLLLAKNCRTSYDMIQKFYGSHLEAEMNVKQLHRQGRAMGRQF